MSTSTPNPETLIRLRSRFDELDRLGKEPGEQVARDRGNKFEGLLLDLLGEHDLLVRRSFHTADNRREQIDGAIRLDGRLALVEAKWTKESVAASELYAFLGKVEGKFAGTIGVFVSRNPLSDNFITSLRSGRRQSVIVVHGDDVAQLFLPDFPLGEYLIACVENASIDNVAHLSAVQFLANRKDRKEAEKEPAGTKEAIKTLLRDLADPKAASLISALVDVRNLAELVEDVEILLRNLPVLLLKSGPGSPLRENVPRYIEASLRRFPKAETPVDARLVETLGSVLARPEYRPIIAAFSERLTMLPSERAQSVSRMLEDAWSRATRFEDENELVEPTRLLWPALDDEAKRALLREFLGIINDYYHRPGFPQFELAKNLLNDAKNRPLRDHILSSMLSDEYKKLLATEETDTADVRDWARKWSVDAFRKARDHLDGFGDVVEEALPTAAASSPS